MKNTASSITNCIISIILTLCLIWCCASAFSIEVNAIVLTACIVIFSSVVALVSALIDNKGKYLMSIAVIGIVFIFFVLFSLGFILSSANYAINCVLKSYSKYLPVPQSISFAGEIADNANAFFVMVAFVLSFVFLVSLIRLRKIFPVVILSVLCLVPNFILVNTLPSLIALVPVVACLFALYVTTFSRKYNSSQNGNLLIISTAVILIAAVVICYIIPVKNYKRSGWQDDMLSYAQKLTGISSSDNSEGDDNSLAMIKQSIEEKKDLTDVGPTAQNSIKVMEVLTPESGNIYLKSVAYANYNQNEWSILTQEQNESFPTDFNAFTMAKAKSGAETTISIETSKKSYTAFTPYFSLDFPQEFNNIRDVVMQNKDRLTSYDITYVPYHSDEEYYTSYTSKFVEYKDFVYANYVDIPEATRDKMLEIAQENGISVQLSGIAEGVDAATDAELLSISAVRKNLIEDIRELISNHGSYSLNTQKMPFGKDFPVWFLNESETGFCIHYATAAAVMLRAHGIPSRYVTGYYVKAEGGGWTTVTSNNAHAWVEYFDDDTGWIPLEATPPSFEPSSYNDMVIYETTIPTTQQVTTQPLTEIATEATTTPIVENNGNTFSIKLGIVHYVILSVALLLLFIALRRKIVIHIRKKHFNKGRNNTKSVYIYRYIDLLDNFSNNVIPDEVIEIAQKAKFSRHILSADEVKLLLDYSMDAKKELLKNSSFIRRIYLKYIIVI